MKNNLKVERQKLNLTQAQLAELVVVSRQTIISIESGKYLPSVLLAIKLAAVLKLSVEEVFLIEGTD